MPRTNKCKCREQVDKELEQFNTRLERPLMLDWSSKDASVGLLISTTKIDPKKRGQKKSVLATHCPFCGKKL